MTTIAITHEQIAADGLVTWDGEVRDREAQKIRVAGKTIYAITGTISLFDVLIEWHQTGADPSEIPAGINYDKNGWMLIVINCDGIRVYTSGFPYAVHERAPIAFGSGDAFAMGALLHGATARDAVKIAATATTETGGKIRSVNIAEVTGFTLRREDMREAAE